MDAQWLLNDEKDMPNLDEGYENGYTPQILDTLKEKVLRRFSL